MNDIVNNTSLIKKYKRLKTPTNLLVIAITLVAFLPACIALFPQESVVPVEKLELDFQNLTTKNGEKVKEVYFNKGL